jgi:hypothetical protein
MPNRVGKGRAYAGGQHAANYRYGGRSVSLSFKRRVSQDGVDAHRLVRELGDAQIDDDGAERKRIIAGQTMLALHQIEHSFDCDPCRLVKVLVKTEGQPARCSSRDWPLDGEVAAHIEGHLRFNWALDRTTRNLAIALRRVAIARREERTFDRDWQKQNRSRDELFAVDVSAAAARGNPGSAGGIPRTPRKGARRTVRPAA